MNNIKNKRTGLKLLGSVRGANYKRFTYNKTQQNQVVYENVEPRCPGKKGSKGCQNCLGSNTNIGCKTCMGCTYSIDVSSNIFLGAYPTYGSFTSINPVRDISGAPCEWQYNAIVEGFNFNGNALYDSTVTLNIESNRCVNVQDICGVYFYEPVGGNLGVYAGLYTDCNGIKPAIDASYNITNRSQNKFVTNAKRMGAPYRNPIAGWRKTLNCCEKPCKVILYDPAGTHITSPNIIKGVTQYSQTVNGQTCNGTIVDYISIGNTYYEFTVELDNCCCVPIPGINNPGHITGNGHTHEYFATNVVVITRGTSGAAKQATNNIYKDTYSGRRGAGLDGCGACAVDCSNNVAPRSGIQGRTHQPIIRSGMQEKRPCCRDNNGKCNKTNDYSFSYWQYQHNKRCLDYQRNQEKYVRNFPACGMFHGRFQCLNAYRKSSCCDCTCEPCKQKISLFVTPPDINIGDLITQTAGGNPNGATGNVVAILLTEGGNQATFEVETTSCDKPFNINGGPGTGIVTIQFPSGPYNNTATFGAVNGGGGGENCNKAMAKTIYKPSNKKFSRQGAVTSGGRLERLKLDTITAANSKCIKGRRCKEIPTLFPDVTKVYKYPNGTYGGGKPRFTGWMFNGHHREVKGRVYNMVRYNQQPLGIPQLTANPPGKTCIKKCFPRTLDLGSNRPTAAGNRARIPGSICESCSATCFNLPTQDNDLNVVLYPPSFPVPPLGSYKFWGWCLDCGPTGSFIPDTIAGKPIKWLGYQARDPSSTYFDNRFYVALTTGDTSGTQSMFNSISFVDCNDNSVKTYYTSDSLFNAATTGTYSTWVWGNNTQTEIPSETAYWSSKEGTTLKVYIDTIPKICKCKCDCNNIPYQSGQGLPCCN